MIDHSDHVASGFFALEASHAYTAPHEFIVYRDYSTDDENIYGETIPAAEATDVSSAQLAAKTTVLASVYGLSCTPGVIFGDYCPRHYSIANVYGGTGALRGASGSCLGTSGGSSASGTAAVMGACTGAATQSWTFTADSLVETAGMCLTVSTSGGPPTDVNSPPVLISTCVPNAQQRWTLTSNGQLRGVNGSCLNVGSDGVSLTAALCQANKSGSQYLPLSAQTFVPAFSPATPWSASGDFADTQVGTAMAYWGSLTLGDINGDGYADACVRLSGGLYCALNNRAGGFAPLTLFSAAFSDAAGFSGDAYGSTVRLVDVNADGLADVCGRSAQGIVCALSNGSGFGPATLWTSSFSDAGGFGSAQGYWGSIRFGDVNGDGYADVCGRSSSGVVCALNGRNGSFGTASLWSSTFTDASGWLPAQYGATLVLGDVNGDNKADVCLRGPSGVLCETANAAGTAFENDHLWSFRADFSDADGFGSGAGYWGSLELADVNGDGFADLCGRAPAGLVCAISNGFSFDKYQPWGAGDFSDAAGFQLQQYGSTLRMGNLNHNGRADACARSSTALYCATSP